MPPTNSAMYPIPTWQTYSAGDFYGCDEALVAFHQREPLVDVHPEVTASLGIVQQARLIRQKRAAPSPAKAKPKAKAKAKAKAKTKAPKQKRTGLNARPSPALAATEAIVSAPCIVHEPIGDCNCEIPLPAPDLLQRRQSVVNALEALPTGADTPQALMESMLTIHLSSQPLAALPPGKRMKSDVYAAWTDVQVAETTILGQSLDMWEGGGRSDVAGLSLLNATLSLLALPASSLVPISVLRPATGAHTIEIEKALCGADVSLDLIDLGAPPFPTVDATSRFNNIPLEGVDPSTTSGAALFEISAANRAMRRDRQSVATRILTSNGAPARSKRVADALSDKQQQRTQPLLFHEPAGPVIKPALEEVIKALQK